ncbi:MAG: nucleotidyltransferase domain-containing protein [Oligoflexia bacterium]|nr:nucleotidyltransferase domain-containing protein [Oligoflexia bacterium]
MIRISLSVNIYSFDDIEVRLFGSYHKGTATEWSDIDLAVIAPDFMYYLGV